MLSIGKVALRRVAGVLPGRHAFRMPDDDPLPDADWTSGTDVRDQILHLAVPLRRAGELDVDREAGADELVRHDVRELQARNDASSSGDPAVLEVGTLRTRLLLASEVTQAYACVPLAHIVECRADRQVVLNERFIPTVMHARIGRAAGVVHQRAARVCCISEAKRWPGAWRRPEGAPRPSSPTFSCCRPINRYEPLLAHYAALGRSSSRELFQVLRLGGGRAGDVHRDGEAAAELPAYRHERLRESFEPVIARAARVAEQGAGAERHLDSRSSRGGSASASPSSAIDRCTAARVFILAARADLPSEELRRRFPAQLKIGPAEKIGDLVRLQLPGVPVQRRAGRAATDSVSRRVRRISSSIKPTRLWEQLKDSGGIAMHVAGEFPGLALEFWAIRS